MKGRHIEAATVEESKRLLASFAAGSRRTANYDSPSDSVVDIATPYLIQFSGNAVPPNFQNLHLPHVRPRWQGPSRWSVAADWRDWAAVWGRRALARTQLAAGVSRVEVVFWRVRQMDKDGRFGAAKHILDGLVDAGLVSADDPDHLPDDCYEARQTRVSSFGHQATVVTVERLP